MARECASCEWFDRNQCKRFPPTYTPWPTDNQHPIRYDPVLGWPNVENTDWCGEFKFARALDNNPF